jgi:hypothetical protein
MKKSPGSKPGSFFPVRRSYSFGSCLTKNRDFHREKKGFAKGVTNTQKPKIKPSKKLKVRK